MCFRHKPKIARVNDQSKLFAATIVGYAGPWSIRASKQRGQSSCKGYFAVFTCMSKKAVHLEAVGDMTNIGFLHVLDRFVSFRGYCYNSDCDCGTNIVSEIKRLQKEFQETFDQSILPFLTTQNIQWHLRSPSTPHFNGLAAVKLMEYHLSRIICQSKLTIEKFSTVLSRIEAVIISRIISAITDNDFTAITPGDSLTGNALLARRHI